MWVRLLCILAFLVDLDDTGEFGLVIIEKHSLREAGGPEFCSREVCLQLTRAHGTPRRYP